MLDQSTRTAILRLRDQGHGSQAIAQALGISRNSVKKVLRGGHAEVPPLKRAQKAEPYLEQIRTLHATCKGNLIRVHEEIVAQGAKFSYQALTAFCRQHGIGHEPERPAGRYDFPPGEEMQHDTSPHRASVGGRVTPVQSASLVLGYSHMLFFQGYPRFTRFECKIFLNEGFGYYEGACSRCIVDNSHLVVLTGTGRSMVPVPEMAAFGDRFGFEFVAHTLGDKNRSGKVERPFHFIENNFFAGRTFRDWDDLNTQARAWCDKVNATPKRHLHASPRELFAREQPCLQPLPLHVPEVYRLHLRIVDTEGYVNVQGNRYSVPWQPSRIGRSLEIREGKDRIDVYDGPRQIASHKRHIDGTDVRVTDPSHRPPRGQGPSARTAPSLEQQRLLERAPETQAYIALLKKRGRGSVRDLRSLLRMLDDYPRDAFCTAIDEATQYGMVDLDRLQRMILRRIARDFFPPPTDPTIRSDKPEETDHDG
jgi:transposase